MNKPILVIIYNHKFEQNIEKLERYYADKFSNIFHLVPFYEGHLNNVIAVYENSHYFQGYIAQGFSRFFTSMAEHYLFVADDLILNPLVNEHNYKDHLHLGPASGFIPGVELFHEKMSPNFWRRTHDAYYYSRYLEGLEVAKELPERSAMEDRLLQHKISLKPLTHEQIHAAVPKTDGPRNFMQKVESLYGSWLATKNKLTRKQFSLPYPLVGSYADIVVVPAISVKKFAHYCGCFAATRLHVEVALPTSLLLTTDEIVQEMDIELKGLAMWSEQDTEWMKPFQNDFSVLISNFPEQALYLHPIKLSKWANS
ncbi:MAG: hypothetical protein V4717_15715 [Bacteroidota bacterium]